MWLCVCGSDCGACMWISQCFAVLVLAEQQQQQLIKKTTKKSQHTFRQNVLFVWRTKKRFSFLFLVYVFCCFSASTLFFVLYTHCVRATKDAALFKNHNHKSSVWLSTVECVVSPRCPHPPQFAASTLVTLCVCIC